MDNLASRLQRSVAADNQEMRFLVSSRHYGDEDPARIRAVLNRDLDSESVNYLLSHDIAQAFNVVEIPEATDLKLKARRCFPIRWDGQLLGFLWLIDDRGAKDDDAAIECAHKMAMTIYGRSIRHEQELVHRESLVRDLLAADTQASARAERDLRDDGLLGEDSLCVIVIEVPMHRPLPADARRASQDQISELSRLLSVGQILSAPIGRRILAALAPNKTSAANFESELLDALTSLKLSNITDSFIGVGGLVRPSRAPESYTQARLAARAATVLPALGPVATWDRLGVYGQLLRIASDGDGHLALPSSLIELQNADKQGVLVGTAEAYLDAAGSSAKCAELLHIHRSTLHYRIGRIEAITGLDLEDGKDRLTLHLGLKVSRILEAGKTPLRQRAESSQ